MTAFPHHQNSRARQSGESKRIVLLTTASGLANCVSNHLTEAFPNLVILVEDAEKPLTKLKRRMRIAGPLQGVGQMMAAFLFRLVAKNSQSRIREICTQARLSAASPPKAPIIKVGSVNSAACRETLQRLNPDVVAVYGTRLISKTTLACVPAPFINYHAGITPDYRGQHPAYWARVQNNTNGTGVTIHLIDSGVDTGAVLAQKRVNFSEADNITTYQWLQMAAALPLFVACLRHALEGDLTSRPLPPSPSRVWLPPTAWGYVCNGMLKGVW